MSNSNAAEDIEDEILTMPISKKSTMICQFSARWIGTKLSCCMMKESINKNTQSARPKNTEVSIFFPVSYTHLTLPTTPYV